MQDDEVEPPKTALWEERTPGSVDERLRRLLRFLVSDVDTAISVEPVIARGLIDAAGDRHSEDALLLGLSYAIALRRPPPPHLLIRPGDHRNELSLRIFDPERVEAVWRIDEIIGRMLKARDELLDPQSTIDVLADRIALVDRIGHAVTGISTKDSRSVDKEESAFVIGVILLVAELRLPSVLARLVEKGLLQRDFVELLIPNLIGSDTQCVIELIRGRRPTTAAKLQAAEDRARDHDNSRNAGVKGARPPVLPTTPAPTSERPPSVQEVVDGARFPLSLGASKWTGLTRLLVSLGLVNDSSLPKAVQVSYSDSLFNLGDLADPDVREVVWERLAMFLLLVGIGAVSTLDLEGVRGEVLMSEERPSRVRPVKRGNSVKR